MQPTTPVLEHPTPLLVTSPPAIDAFTRHAFSANGLYTGNCSNAVPAKLGPGEEKLECLQSSRSASISECHNPNEPQCRICSHQNHNWA